LEKEKMEDKRFVLFPIVDDESWRAYKDQEASFWTAEEIDLTDDAKHFRDKLNDGERRLLLRVLGFFAGSDTIVAQNIDMNFINECDKRGWLETIIAYQFQTMMENIHSEAYSLMIDELISEKKARLELFDSISQVPSIKQKANWCIKWMGTSDRPDALPDFVRQNMIALSENLSPKCQLWLKTPCPTFGERLVAFTCVEAILFSSSFAIIFWFKKRGLLPGISFANELISRDERMHHEFGSATFHRLKTASHLPETVPSERILEIVTSCVEVEKAFVRDALPVKLAGINEEKLCEYVEFMADRVLLDLGCERHYYVGTKTPKNPCEWMEKISLDHKTNFFERRVTNYQRRGVKQIENAATLNTFSTDADF
jgi:ribonucleotide reductase beta subunit family protein with ferritin-like domain